MLKTNSESPILIKSPVIVDDRGTFSPTPIVFSHKYPLYIRKDWLQTNISINPRPYTFRGMHFQDPYPQSKLIKVIQGQIVDFLIDIRANGSLKFSKWEMNAGDMLYVPKGFAHGFFTLQPYTVVQYLVDEDYRPDYEDAIAWDSIEWIYQEVKSRIDSGFNNNISISDKDRDAKTLEKYLDEPNKYEND
jgi:dTDP-4-dehydrorhamnose 3,5-epimerase